MLPSWGETEVGPVFLTDADIDLLPLELQSDAHGHKAIRYIYPAKEFREREGWADCPREMLDAMRAGKMDRIIRQSGVRLFFPRDGETISPKDHEVYIVTSGVVNSSAQTGGDCMANSGGVVNSSAQTGGDCGALYGGVVNSSAKAGGYCLAFSGGVVNQIEEKKQ